MRLTAKLVTAIVLGIIILIAADAFISVRRAVALFTSDMQADADVLVRVLRPVLENEWAANGIDRARQILDDANGEEQSLQFRWVSLDAEPEDPFRPQVPAGSLDPVRGGDDLSLTAIGRDGREHLFTYAPLSRDGERTAALELSESTRPIDDFTRSIIRRAVALGSISAVLGAGVVFSLGFFMVGRPLHAIMGKVRRVGRGDLDEPLVIRRRDELGELADSVNEMCANLAEARERIRAETIERIKAIEQLRHADRLATVGTLASGIAHELGTPLNVVTIRARLIVKRSELPQDIRENGEVIHGQATRMTTIIRQLLEFARRQAPTVTAVNIADLLRGCTELLSSIARKSAVEINLPSSSGVPSVPADRGQLQQVFTNLIINAIQAMPRGGRLALGLETVDAEPPRGHGGRAGKYLRIDVADEGEGIAPDDLRHIFDPFFTTKDVGEGTGLGLSIAYGIITEHGGWIDVSSHQGKGSRFSVYLPLERA